jgi:hypothetical protein
MHLKITSLKYRVNIYQYMNNNEHNALFIFCLLSYNTATCFGWISSLSLENRMYICGKRYSLYRAVDCQLAS